MTEHHLGSDWGRLLVLFTPLQVTLCSEGNIVGVIVFMLNLIYHWKIVSTIIVHPEYSLADSDSYL